MSHPTPTPRDPSSPTRRVAAGESNSNHENNKITMMLKVHPDPFPPLGLSRKHTHTRISVFFLTSLLSLSTSSCPKVVSTFPMAYVCPTSPKHANKHGKKEKSVGFRHSHVLCFLSDCLHRAGRIKTGKDWMFTIFLFSGLKLWFMNVVNIGKRHNLKHFTGKDKEC